MWPEDGETNLPIPSGPKAHELGNAHSYLSLTASKNRKVESNIDISAPQPGIKISSSGTLGDHLIVLCKAYHIYLDTGKQIEVSVFSDHPSYEAWIKQLFETTSFVRIAGHIQQFSALFTQIEEGTISGPYVNSSPLPETLNGLPDDPDWVRMEAYPEFQFSAESVAPNQFVIQLNAGGDHNAKGFDIPWVLSVCQQLESSGTRICILGTGGGYSEEQLRQLEQFDHVDNLVGKTEFDQWLATLAGAKAVISLEGFAAFFALANGIKTAIYNEYPYFEVARALHPSWLDHTCLQHVVHPNKYVRKAQRVISQISGVIKGNSGANRYSPKDTASLVRFLLLDDNE